MSNLPEEFIQQTRQLMGEERFNRYLGAFEEEAPVSVRVNRRKEISQSDRHLVRVPWCEEGYYLQGRPQFTFDPLFHAGCYYVQEASSMFITHILRTLQGNLLPPFSFLLPRKSILDLCAAPGGKSTAAISVMPEGSLMVSNEPIPNRAQILLENITKWGYPNCIVTNNYPRDFRKAKARFDIIICDVPCSGEGMFRKDPATIGEWSLQNVEKCWRLQREIVADAWECLNPGGILIYSTCTFNTKENEENVRWIIDEYDAEILDIPTAPEWNITGSLLKGFDAPVYRFIPGITKGEGLFICAIRKSGELPTEVPAPSKSKSIDPSKSKPFAPFISKLKVLESDLPQGDFPCYDLTYPEVLKYLRGEAIVLPSDAPKGHITVTYEGHALGPVKNIGNRANNLYPKPWRIKSTHLPSSPPHIIV
jgi:16S rRNA C967 or C1407 C5-methylase (RsmB/RsmF family)